jgi:hypothetical protein
MVAAPPCLPAMEAIPMLAPFHSLESTVWAIVIVICGLFGSVSINTPRLPGIYKEKRTASNNESATRGSHWDSVGVKSSVNELHANRVRFASPFPFHPWHAQTRV